MYKRFDDFLRQMMEFHSSSFLHAERRRRQCVVLALVCRDILIASQYKNEIKELKERLNLEFEM